MAIRWVSTATMALAASALLALSSAQTTTNDMVTGTSSRTSSALATTQSAATVPSAVGTISTATGVRESRIHLVTAGVGGFQFEPAELTNVSVGDVVTFEFYPPDHSVARAEYDSACVPYEYTGKGKTGFWSETQWVETASDITRWNLTINSTEPIFYYCAAPNSCMGKQMVGVINPNSTQTLGAQILAAAKADFQVAPGEPIPKEASSTLVAAPTAASSHEVSTTAKHHSTGLSHAAIVGIVFGGIAFTALCAAALFYVARRTRNGYRAAHATPPCIPAGVHPISPDTRDNLPPFSPSSTIMSPCGYPYQEYFHQIPETEQRHVHPQVPSRAGPATSPLVELEDKRGGFPPRQGVN